VSAINSDCDKRFFPAYHQSGTRELSDIYWIGLHDEEAASAAGSASYFRDPKSGGSAHICVDDIECYRSLANETIPWAMASAPQLQANLHGWHIEQAGFAKWSLIVWKKHIATLRRAAFKAAYHGILFKHPQPVQFVTAADLIAYGRGGPLKKGITTHGKSARRRRCSTRRTRIATHTATQARSGRVFSSCISCAATRSNCSACSQHRIKPQNEKRAPLRGPPLSCVAVLD
jgi:hypothetical protein